MTRIDFATRRRAVTITKKQTVLAALDALITGMLMILFLAVALGTMWLIFGR